MKSGKGHHQATPPRRLAAASGTPSPQRLLGPDRGHEGRLTTHPTSNLCKKCTSLEVPMNLMPLFIMGRKRSNVQEIMPFHGTKPTWIPQPHLSISRRCQDPGKWTERLPLGISLITVRENAHQRPMGCLNKRVLGIKYYGIWACVRWIWRGFQEMERWPDGAISFPSFRPPIQGLSRGPSFIGSCGHLMKSQGQCRSHRRFGLSHTWDVGLSFLICKEGNTMWTLQLCQEIQYYYVD